MKKYFATMGRLGATVAGTDPCSTGGHPKLQQEKRRLQMNKFRLTIKLLVIAIFMFAFASIAQAQATRTWVSGVGDDANPCSRTAPCKTFAGAISKTATGGEIDCLDPGGFGAVTITKSITIDGTTGAGFGSILASLVNGVIVNGVAGSNGSKVILKNLSINGVGNGLDGIRYLAGQSLTVEGCQIFGFTGQGIDAASLADNSQLIVTNTKFNSIAAEGIRLQTSAGQATAMIEGSLFQKCATGVFFGERTRGAVRNSVFSHNTNGLVSTAPTTNDSQVNIDNCLFTYGSVGIQAGAGATVLRVTRSTIVQNSTGINLTGGSAFSNGNNAVLGNTGGETFTGAVIPLK
jgi:hypothetical protein